MKLRMNEFHKMKKIKYKIHISKKIAIRTILFFMVIFTCIEYIGVRILKIDIANKKETADYFATIALDKIENELNVIQAKIKSVSNFSVDSDGNITGFERAASTVIGNDYIHSVALAPSGVIQYVYPSTANKRYKEYDFSSSQIDHNRTMIVDPHLFEDGETFLGIRIPVLLNDSNGNAELWGYICGLIEFPDILFKEGIDLLSTQNYKFRLYRRDDFNKEINILTFMHNKIEQGITIDYELFNQTWNVLIEPENGWFDKREFILKTIVIFIISFLITIIVYNYYRLKEIEKMLSKLVNIDTLTGLFSRKYFYDYVEYEIRKNHSFGICYVDVDKFKEVNDQYGHEVGDKLLFEIANRMQGCIRRNEFISRIGGDEFVIFIKEIDGEFDGNEIVDRLKMAMKEDFTFKNISVNNSLSIGYSTFPQDGQRIEELIQKADAHMYNMKERNRVNNHIKYHNHNINKND